MTYAEPFPTKNTGDAWSAAEHRIYIKGNQDHLNTKQMIDFEPDHGYAPITGSAPSGPTSVGGGASITYRYLGYSATAQNNWCWGIPSHAMWNTNTGNGTIEIWGTMGSNNTGSKFIRIRVFIRSYAPGDDFDNLVFPASDLLDYEVDNTASNLMNFEIPITNGDLPANENEFTILCIARFGGATEDTASGTFNFISARLKFDMDD